MLEPAVVLLRLVQYAAGAILLGSSLFFVYALPKAGAGSAAQSPWARRLILASASTLAVSALLGLAAQTAVMAGSWAEGLKPDSLAVVVSDTALGRAGVVRALAAVLAAGAALVLRPGRATWLSAAALGALACASFAWMGHGAATEGSGRFVHLASDVLHAWAAAVWIGALCGFLGLVLTRGATSAAAATLHRALRGFAGLGSLLVATLIVTGIVNSGFLVGPDRLTGLWTTAYGRLLTAKVLLFLVMLGLAAVNRFRLTPALGAALDDAAARPDVLRRLRRSLALETGLGFAVLALVAWFGTLQPFPI